jgi:hypothetical protein
VFRIESESDPRTRTDPRELTWILDNLLASSFKFGFSCLCLAFLAFPCLSLPFLSMICPPYFLLSYRTYVEPRYNMLPLVSSLSSFLHIHHDIYTQYTYLLANVLYSILRESHVCLSWTYLRLSDTSAWLERSSPHFLTSRRRLSTGTLSSGLTV